LLGKAAGGVRGGDRRGWRDSLDLSRALKGGHDTETRGELPDIGEGHGVDTVKRVLEFKLFSDFSPTVTLPKLTNPGINRG